MITNELRRKIPSGIVFNERNQKFELLGTDDGRLYPMGITIHDEGKPKFHDPDPPLYPLGINMEGDIEEEQDPNIFSRSYEDDNDAPLYPLGFPEFEH